jgi:large subunit ribosomal protein L35
LKWFQSSSTLPSPVALVYLTLDVSADCFAVDTCVNKYCSAARKERAMPKQKLKTHKAMAKRVKVTAGGKILRRKVGINHLRRNKSPQAVRSMDKTFQLATADTRRLKRLLPYAF